jgi:hypothetical protein
MKKMRMTPAKTLSKCSDGQVAAVASGTGSGPNTIVWEGAGAGAGAELFCMVGRGAHARGSGKKMRGKWILREFLRLYCATGFGGTVRKAGFRFRLLLLFLILFVFNPFRPRNKQQVDEEEICF